MIMTNAELHGAVFGELDVWKGHAADRRITYLDEPVENLKAEVLAQWLMELVGDEYANIYEPGFVTSLSEAEFDEMFYLRGIPRAAMVPHCRAWLDQCRVEQAENAADARGLTGAA